MQWQQLASDSSDSSPIALVAATLKQGLFRDRHHWGTLDARFWRAV